MLLFPIIYLRALLVARRGLVQRILRGLRRHRGRGPASTSQGDHFYVFASMKKSS